MAQALSLDIPDQQFTVILGPNGCGKSTLLRGLSRLLTPREGSITFDGKQLDHYPRHELAKLLGLLPQSAIAPGGVTVHDLVARGRFPHQSFLRRWTAADEQAVRAAIAATQIEPLLEQSVESLSGGQRQRVWVAMVLAQDTPYLLLDEPTTYLDIAHQIELLELFKTLNQQQGRTIVAVLHDLNHACRYADHLVVMKSGEIIAQGAPKQIITETLIKEVYGLNSVILDDPLTHTPLVLPNTL
ncbi:ABC transporter ATP-binding protein [Photobacterium sp. TY1-4]|uniref:ABC transporter ATP-binding protein n=1 Tax=Photobacterium sp. TY1-4 TaxID=2899122 RepID=UPI0021C14B64|nr:ABC transporter ATP-binding protein [Photobacterium sp. TY1-4]UXI04629.1 ABC transporter ATP-binding protein [Photobacterium sp. TY1-4]